MLDGFPKGGVSLWRVKGSALQTKVKDKFKIGKVTYAKHFKKLTRKSKICEWIIRIDLVFSDVSCYYFGNKLSKMGSLTANNSFYF